MVLLCNVLSLCALATALVVPNDPIDFSAMVDKRAPQGILASDVTQKNFKFYMEVKVGSQGKVLHPCADTGSPTSWLPNTDDWANHSTSLVNTTEPFSIAYLNSKALPGYYVEDSFTVDDGTIHNFKFGVVENPASFAEGTIGLSRPWRDYTTFVQRLQQDGLIGNQVSSVYYSADKKKGKFIFGGYDQAKVGSEWSTHYHPSQFKVPVTNITVNGKTTYPEYGDYPIVVDTGATQTCLPQVLIDEIIKFYKNPEVYGAGYIVDCDAPEGSFQLGVGDLVVDIPFKDFLNDHAEGAKRCNFNGNIAEKYGNVTLIGGSVLRKLVTVFDYEFGVVKIAHLKDTDDEDIVKA